jgi:hypothetical protein
MLTTVGMLLLAAIAWALTSATIAKSYAPVPEAETFDGFVAYYGQPFSIIQFDEEHIVATVEVPFWHLVINTPSSMPGYVFDRNGKLVDWSPDPGDDSNFQNRWLKANRHAISIDQVMGRMQAR